MDKQEIKRRVEAGADAASVMQRIRFVCTLCGAKCISDPNLYGCIKCGSMNGEDEGDF